MTAPEPVEPPQGIVNVPLVCGHATQMKRTFADMRRRDNQPVWCMRCDAFRELAPAIR